jgi:mono/diheme cytochrome c family protein
MNRSILLISIGIILYLGACVGVPPNDTEEIQTTTISPIPTLDPNFGFQTDSELIQATSDPLLPTLDPQRVSRGEEVYEQYCAVCHGANLEGQPDWRSPLPDGSFRAPPHDSTGHTWHHSDEVILDIIAEGSNPVFGGTMQGFADVIDPQDMLAVLDFIKSHWGQDEREFQWMITSQTQ